MGQYIPLRLAPGLKRTGTKYQSRGAWYDSNLIRFVKDTVRPVGGWAPLSSELNTGGGAGPLIIESTPRGAHGFEVAGGRAWQLYGTVSSTNKVYSYSAGTHYVITPAGLSAGNVDTASGGATASGAYGSGLYDVATYGIAQLLATVDYADIWHMDNFGNLGVMCQVPSNDSIYVYDPSTPATVAALVANAPTNNLGCFVTPDRFLVAIGADNDPRSVAWSDREDYTTWAPLSTNEAGDFPMPGPGRCVRGMAGRGESLIWTDSELWAMIYIGGDFVYSFQKRGDGCGLPAPLAVGTVNGGHAWMGTHGFFTYDGYVRPLECPVEDYIFSDINSAQGIKVAAWTNQEWNEIWWFYPSAGSTENDRYVLWNYEENTWAIGSMDRTCAIPATTTNNKPILLHSTGDVYQHESGFDHSPSQSLAQPYVESGPIEIGTGDRIFAVTEFVPDESNEGDTQTEFYHALYPNDSETLVGPFANSGLSHCRFQARQVRLRVEELVTASDWRVGEFRIRATQRGRR